MSKPELNITVATAPTDLTLREEIRLAKPALLYGDHVTLYSPTAMMLASAEHVAALDNDGLAQFIRLASGSIGPQAEQLADYYEALRDKPRRDRAELQEFLKVKRLLRGMADELQTAIRPMLEEAGAAELAPAIDAGLVEIDPLLTDFADNTDELMDAFIEKLQNLLTGQFAYPLFDEEISSLVRSGVEDGMFEIGPTSRRRSKNVGMASDFIARVPAFPGASLAEILDIRNELQASLARFRAAITSFSRGVEAAAHDVDFTAELEELYLAEIEPVLLEIREAVEANRYLKQLSRRAVSEVQSTLKTGGAVALGLMGLADAPAVASVAVGLGAAAVQVAADAATKRAATATAVERNKLFFLYRTETALSD